MEIVINARFLSQSITGVQRYAIELVKELDGLIASGEVDFHRFEFILLAPRSIVNEISLKNIPLRRVGSLTGHAWEQLELPFYAGGRFLINLCNTAPILKRNQMVTIHDASVFAYPGTYSVAFRTWYSILFMFLAKAAKRIITVSSFSRNELISYCGMKGSKIEVTYLGNEHIFSVSSDSSVLNRKGMGKRAFILAVSSLNPNKNFRGIMNAVNLLGKTDFDIVISGGANPRVFRQSMEELPDGIKYLGYVSDSELRALYENAVCLVYPSFYEGFGLPPLEAMACGCPVIVSNAASLPEVCGDAALYCDPHSVEDIAEKIKEMVTNEALRNELRQKGLERAKQFTWERCARETVGVIERVLNP